MLADVFFNTRSSHYLFVIVHIYILLHCKNKIVKITNLLINTVARNSGNCNLIGSVDCYDRMVTYM